MQGSVSIKYKPSSWWKPNFNPCGSGRATFACDAMLGGMARWLRAARYEASWHPGIDDPDLVQLARSATKGRLT
jgi:hypothetical protein